MIRPEELRIGNLITDNFYDTFQGVIEVESISEKGVNLTASDDGKPYGMHSGIIECEYDFEEINGIPITPEWLERFGFRRENEFMYTIGHADYSYVATHRSTGGFKDGGYFFGIRYDDWDLDPNTVHGFAYAINGIQHVHQLQNLFFALTGEELKLVERLNKQ